MNKLITIIFLAIVFNFMLISCDDRNNETKESYPCIYTQDRVEYMPVALYTNKGIIYDTKEIKAFRERLRAKYEKEVNSDNEGNTLYRIVHPEDFGNFVFDDMIEYYNNDEIFAKQVSKDSIEIINPNFILSGWVNQWGDLEYESGILSAVKQKNGIIYWESTDTTSINAISYIDVSLYFYILSPDLDKRLILRSIFDSLTPLYYVENQFPDVIGLNFYSKQKSCIYLTEDKKGIYIPFIEMLYKNQGKSATYKLNNIPLLDNQIISKIAEGDTLVLQQSRLYLSKYSNEK